MAFDRYFATALSRTVADLEERGVTTRELYRAAERLGQLLHLDGADEVEARRALFAVAAAALAPDAAERAVHDGFADGRAKPYSPNPAASRNASRPPAPARATMAPRSDAASTVERRVAQLEERVARIADALRLAAEGGR
jgi:hypothetical protein